jgi:hypothetical protein
MVMTEAKFVELLAIYGADLARWPEAQRATASMMLETGPHRIKDLWESERTFDRLLALEADGPASIGLETRILAHAPRPPRPARSGTRTLWGSRAQWAAGALGTCLALGFAAGYAAEPAGVEQEYAQMLALTGGDAGAVFLSAIDDGDR